MVISCMSALPMEVTRSEICMGFPSMVPSQEPARDFNWLKDFCASDWAKARVESPMRAAESRIRRGFICASFWCGGVCPSRDLLLYLTTTLGTCQMFFLVKMIPQGRLKISREAILDNLQ